MAESISDNFNVLNVFLSFSFERTSRSGQVRSECLMCRFRASYCSARLSRAQVPAFTGSSVRDRKKRKGGGGGGETSSTNLVLSKFSTNSRLISSQISKRTACAISQILVLYYYRWVISFSLPHPAIRVNTATGHFLDKDLSDLHSRLVCGKTRRARVIKLKRTYSNVEENATTRVLCAHHQRLTSSLSISGRLDGSGFYGPV